MKHWRGNDLGRGTLAPPCPRLPVRLPALQAAAAFAVAAVGAVLVRRHRRCVEADAARLRLAGLLAATGAAVVVVAPVAHVGGHRGPAGVAAAAEVVVAVRGSVPFVAWFKHRRVAPLSVERTVPAR